MKTLYYVLVIIACFAFGYFINNIFYTFSVSQLDLERMTLNSRDISEKKIGAIVLGFVYAIVPLCFLLIKKVSKIDSKFKSLTSVMIVILVGLGFWRLRILGLNEEFKQISQLIIDENSIPKVEVSYLKFDIYLLMGFIVGTLISILLFRDRSKPLLNN